MTTDHFTQPQPSLNFVSPPVLLVSDYECRMIAVVVCWLAWLAGGGAGQEVWHNQWAVRVQGGPAAAARVAAGAGLRLAGNIGDLPDTYLLHAPRLTKRSEQPARSDCLRKIRY